MYTYIPVKPAIKKMLHILHNHGVTKDEITEFENLIKLCLEKNACSFRGITYQFSDGLPMGNPLSPLVADVYMDDLEQQLSANFPEPNILFWKRYVDDVLCVWDGPPDSSY